MPDSTPGALEVVPVAEGRELPALLTALKAQLEHFGPDEVVVLSPFGEQSSLVGRFLAREPANKEERQLRDLLSGERAVAWRSIFKGKGLDAAAVVLTDITPDAAAWADERRLSWNDLLYVGMTRAQYRCTVLRSEGAPWSGELDAELGGRASATGCEPSAVRRVLAPRPRWLAWWRAQAEPRWASYLDALDALLGGGLSQAPVFVTGDFDHQVIYRRHEGTDEAPDAPPTPRKTILRRVPGLRQLRLTSNVRTTPEAARFVAESIGEPTLYSEHRRSDDDQVSVERHTYTTMDEQQRLLADAVERILSEPFTVRELVILSPYARERSAVGQALADATADARLTSRLGTGIEDPTRIRWGSIHEFKGIEAPAVILTDVDLSKGHHRDLLYVGASRATDRLVVLEQS